MVTIAGSFSHLALVWRRYADNSTPGLAMGKRGIWPASEKRKGIEYKNHTGVRLCQPVGNPEHSMMRDSKLDALCRKSEHIGSA